VDYWVTLQKSRHLAVLSLPSYSGCKREITMVPTFSVPPVTRMGIGLAVDMLINRFCGIPRPMLNVCDGALARRTVLLK
jgi:hypothetical protein